MKRAEEIDFEQAVYDAFGQVKDFTLAMRIARYFYEKAEKDLALTWEDAKRIVHFYYEMQYEALPGELDVKFVSDDFFQELLKRFNESKITESL